MREDFKKVLCEEPRRKGWGGGEKSLNKYKGANKRLQNDTKGEYDSWTLIHKESMFGKRRRGTKEFGEHLQPLVRFLRKSVGRPWDKIFSEIRERCPNDNAVNAHIYQHLWGYVERHAQIIDGKIYQSPNYSFGRALQPLLDRGRDNTFYVDKFGILRRAPRMESSKVKQQSQPDIIIKQEKTFVRVNGVWYKMGFKPLGAPTQYTQEFSGYRNRVYKRQMWRYPDFVDVYLGVSNNTKGWDGQEGALKCKNLYGKEVYCWQLQQLNSREIKKLRLGQ